MTTINATNIQNDITDNKVGIRICPNSTHEESASKDDLIQMASNTNKETDAHYSSDVKIANICNSLIDILYTRHLFGDDYDTYSILNDIKDICDEAITNIDNVDLRLVIGDRFDRLL